MSANRPALIHRPSRTLARARSAAIAVALLYATSAWSTESAAWQDAEDAYARDHYAVALDGFQRLAAQGDARAAERAGLMLLYGERLYGTQVPRDTHRAGRLLVQASKGGREAAQHLLKRPAAMFNATAPINAAGPIAAEEEPYVLGPYGC